MNIETWKEFSDAVDDHNDPEEMAYNRGLDDLRSLLTKKQG